MHKFETLTLHAGIETDSTMARGVPVHRTSSYLFRDTEHAADLFALKELGNIYSRLQNPTQDVLEKRMAALEGGAAALALSSGTSAIFYSIINICGQGDEIVSSSYLYGGTHTMFSSILPDMGINTRFVSSLDPDDYDAAVTDRTKLIFTEVIGNPSLDVMHIEKLSEVSRKYGIPLIVDSTFTTPYLFRPLEHGADIVVHSLTKWLGGHGTSLGGVVIDSGQFDWTSGAFPKLTEPDDSYHGIRYAYDLGEQLNHLAYIMRMRLVPLRNLGACISPDNAWMILQGIETLPVRMDRHCENAMAAAAYMSQHKQTAWVRYPGLPSDPSHDAARQQFEHGYGGMVVFGVKGGSRAGAKFINSLQLISHLANVGDAKSLAIHPATTTHAQLSDEDKKAGGITPDLIRFSVGLEHIDDILADLDQALAESAE